MQTHKTISGAKSLLTPKITEQGNIGNEGYQGWHQIKYIIKTKTHHQLTGTQKSDGNNGVISTGVSNAVTFFSNE